VRCLSCTLATTHAPLNKAQKKIMTKSASYISSAALSATVLTGPPLPGQVEQPEDRWSDQHPCEQGDKGLGDGPTLHENATEHPEKQQQPSHSRQGHAQ
jgi:hypothetical protein